MIRVESRSFFGVERTDSEHLALTYATLLAAPVVRTMMTD
jgi:hypothetical protein